MAGHTYRLGDADDRPWGSWQVIDVGPNYAVKRIAVRPGGRLSLQMHNHREEHWVVVVGKARVTRDDVQEDVPANHAVTIGPRVVHRVENPGDETLVLIEVQTGDRLSESDIVRLSDDYGRA